MELFISRASDKPETLPKIGEFDTLAELCEWLRRQNTYEEPQRVVLVVADGTSPARLILLDSLRR